MSKVYAAQGLPNGDCNRYPKVTAGPATSPKVHYFLVLHLVPTSPKDVLNIGLICKELLSSDILW